MTKKFSILINMPLNYFSIIQNQNRIIFDICKIKFIKIMKKVIISVLMAMSLPAIAQKINEAKVPLTVKEAFKKNVTGEVLSVKWEKEDGNYEANYLQNGIKSAALFDAKGNWLETEKAIEIKELPAEAVAYLNKNYKGEKIKEAAKLQLPNGVINFEAEVKGKDIIFDNEGKFIKAKKG